MSERLTRALALGFGIAGYGCLLLAFISVVMLFLEQGASPVGAGPVLRAALDSGWRPGPAPKRLSMLHDCSMCEHVEKHPCPPPTSPTRNP